MHYDPMTGKPIPDENDQPADLQQGSNQTAQPDVQSAGEQPETDQETQPDAQAAGEQPETARETQPGGFSYQDDGRQNGPDMGGQQKFSQQTVEQPGGAGMDMQPPVKKKNRLPLVIGICAAAVIALVLILKLVVFADPTEKILSGWKATVNAEQDPLTEQFKKGSTIAEDGEYSASGSLVISGDITDSSSVLPSISSSSSGSGSDNINVTFDYDQKKDGQSAEVKVVTGGKTYDVKETLDDENLTVDLGDLYSSPLQYPYTEDKSSSQITTLMGSETVDTIDQVLKALYSLIEKEPTDVQGILEKHFEELDFKRAGKKSINDTNCTGYKTTLTKEWFEDTYDDLIGSGSTEEIKNLFKTLSSTGDASTNIDFDSLDNCEVTYYLGDGKVLGFDMEQKESGDSASSSAGSVPSKTTVEFSGDKVPWYDTEITGESDGEESKISLKVSDDGDQMVYSLTSSGEDQDLDASMTYRPDDGSFTIENDGNKVLEGTILAEEDKMSIDCVYQNETYGDFTLSMDIEDDPEILSIDGSPQDISEWSQDDWTQFLYELMGVNESSGSSASSGLYSSSLQGF
ncbi:MAG: hypothetical protein ACOYBC_04645 [Bilifractor sp.]